MLINSYLKSIKDKPDTDINTLTDVRDNGTLHIPNIPTLQCIVAKQLPGLNVTDNFKYDVIFEPGFLEIKNTKFMCVQIYITQTNRYKRFKTTDATSWSNWTLSYSTNNKSKLNVKGVMNEALVKSYILKNYIKYDDTDIKNMTNLKVANSLLPNKITRNGDISSGTIGLGTIIVYNGNVHFHGNGERGIYSRSTNNDYHQMLTIGQDNILRTGNYVFTRTVFESVNRPRVVIPGVVDKGAILIQQELMWRMLYNSGNPNAGVKEVGIPAQTFECRSWNKSGGTNNFMHQSHFANGQRVGSDYTVHLRSWDTANEIEHSVRYAQGENQLRVTWNEGDDCAITMVMVR